MAAYSCLQEDRDMINQLNDLLHELLEQKGIEKDLFKNLLIQRKIKHFQNGDAFIPHGRMSSVPLVVWEQILSEVETKTKEWPFSFTCTKLSKDNNAPPVVFYLNRPKAFEHVLRKVKKQGKQYGVTSLAQPPKILINCSHLHSQNALDDLQQLRALLLLSHIVNLFRCNGYTVVGLIPHEGPWNDDTLGSLKIDSLKDIVSTYSQLWDPNESSACTERLLQVAADSSHRSKPQDSPTNGHHPRPNSESSVWLNLRTYLESSDMDSPILKGFDKNLNLVEVCSFENPTPVLEQAASLEKYVLSLKKKDVTVGTVVHFVPSSLSYTQQQVHLVWKMLSPIPHTLKQCHIEFGPVQRQRGIDQNSKTLEAPTYLRKRQEQMKEAVKIKYGTLGEGPEWDNMMNGLLNACVKFELLHPVCRNPVKLGSIESENESDATHNNLGGSFVMYNCARLAMLFQNFRKAVKQGLYPKLPLVSKCDMSTLKLEEEWMLLYNFIEPYPSLVQSTISLSPDQLRSEIHTHKIVNFLVSLSHSFSSYYSRVHILTEPRTHLLPVMFARLHLMSAVHQVMQNGLNLLDIVPPKQL